MNNKVWENPTLITFNSDDLKASGGVPGKPENPGSNGKCPNCGSGHHYGRPCKS